MDKVSVAVNGYGVIGKRVADAVLLQPDMELVGVGDVVSDYRVKAAVVHGLPVYASLPDRADSMREAGIPVVGTLDELLAQVDVSASSQTEATIRIVISPSQEKDA